MLETKEGVPLYPMHSLSKAYTLMTVLKGNLAIKQSKVLIRMFKNIKDYFVENNNFTNSKRLHKFIFQE